MANTRKHTLESCRAVAATVATISQLKKQHENVYAAASRGGWLDALGLQRDTAPAESWTFERIAEVSKQYASRSAMRRGPHQHAYNVARKRGWSDALPKAHKKENGYWTFERCAKEAARCTNRAELDRKAKGAYLAATRKGWIDNLGLPRTAMPTAVDAFYIWQAMGCLFNGKPVYKVGITSWRLGEDRIREVAKTAKLKARIVLHINTPEAASVETFALSLGDNPLLCVPDGRTEFRAYSDAEVGAITKRAIFG